MPRRRYLILNPDQQRELEHTRDHSPLPYLREKAAALLKIAAGLSPHAVARHGLLKARDPDTIYAWMDAYEHSGHLAPRPACRKAFSPTRPTAPSLARTAASAAATIAQPQPTPETGCGQLDPGTDAPL